MWRISRRRGRAAFTLVEMMIGTTLGSIILGGVLMTFLTMGRNGYNAANYSMMEAEARRALDLIETAAILEPRQLRTTEGASVAQTSPLAP